MRPPGLDEIDRLDILWFSVLSCVPPSFSDEKRMTIVNVMSAHQFGSSTIVLTGAHIKKYIGMCVYMYIHITQHFID